MDKIIKFGIGIFVLMFVLSSLSTCTRSLRSPQYRSNSQSAQPSYNVTVQQTNVDGAASGLDLQAVGELVKETQTAAELEKRLNDPGERINNLDLDEDGEVDFIKVTEYGSGDVRGFSLTVELPGDQVQEVATIEIEKEGESMAHIQTHGNPHIYGNNHYYHSRTSLADVLIMGYLFSNMNRSPYNSSWGRGNYPEYYRSYSPVPPSQYQRNVQSKTRSSQMTAVDSPRIGSNVQSPNAGKNASNIKAPLRNPTTAQKSFQARNPSKTVRSGGFGRPSTRSASSSRTPSRPSVRTGSSTRSRSSFGGGK